MKKVLMLVHPRFRPDRAPKRLGTERDVWLALRHLGHQVEVAPALDDMQAVVEQINEFKPHIVFNLMEEFRSEAVYDFHVITYLESKGIPYTGCNPRGLILSRNKFLVGEMAASLGIPAPRGFLIGQGGNNKLLYPRFLKLNREHASLGIRASNLVRNARQFQKTAGRLRRDFGAEILAQEYIPGRDISVSAWGNRSVEVFEPRQLRGARSEISTVRVKFSAAFQRKNNVRSMPYRYSDWRKLSADVRRLYRILDLSGYARFDFRVDGSDCAHLIDVNANPNLVKDEDFASSLRLRKMKYPEVIENILKLGFAYRPSV